MNKYIIPICDLIEAKATFKVVLARSIEDCEDRLMVEFSEEYDENFLNYRDFIYTMDNNYNIAIGEITDIETI